MSTRQTTEHFSTWHQSISNELGPREVDGVSGCCWWMAFALHSRVLGCTYGCSDELYYWQWFSEVFLSPGGDILYTLMSVFDAVPPEGFTGTRLVFGLAAYMQWFLQILWTFWWYLDVDDEIPKFLAMVRWGTLFLNCSRFSPAVCPQSGEPCAIFLVLSISFSRDTIAILPINLH